MSPDLTLAVVALLLAFVSILRSRNTTDTGNAALVTSLASKYDKLTEQQYASALREVAAATEKANSVVILAIVQTKLDTALAELTIVKAQLTLANEQITRLLQLQPSTTALDHETNIAADRASAVTAVQQEVPPLPGPPSPVLLVNADTGEIEKRMVS